MRTASHRGLVVAAAALWPASLFLAWLAATPMGFGSTWGDYDVAGRAFVLAPLIVAPAALAAGWIKRRLWIAAAILLTAPAYQALHLGASEFFSRQA